MSASIMGRKVKVALDVNDLRIVLRALDGRIEKLLRARFAARDKADGGDLKALVRVDQLEAELDEAWDLNRRLKGGDR